MGELKLYQATVSGYQGSAASYSISFFGSLFATAVRAPAGVWCVLVVSVVSCGSERDELGRRVCDYVSHMRGGWRLLVLLDWARGLDGVFFLTRREHHCASAGTALRLLLLTVRVVVVMKSCLPASKVVMESYVR